MACRPAPLLPLGACALVLMLASGPVAAASEAAEASKPAQAPTVKSPAAAAGTRAAGAAGWNRLSTAQKQALAPLAGSWDTLTGAHQRKWLEVSKNYHGLSADEQGKMHARMAEWAALSPQERAQARLNFGKTSEIARELSPAEKRARWEAYQALPAEERQKLAEGAKTRPLGAAPAVKPVPPQKLAVVPAPTAAKPLKPTETSAAAAEPASSN